MKTVQDPRAAARVDAALRSEDPRSLTDFELVVAGENREADLLDLSLTQGDGYGNVLDASLHGRRRKTSEAGNASLDVLVGGAAIKRFRGSVHLEDPETGALTCGTAGFWLDKVQMGRPYAPLGAEPSAVIREAVYRGPHDPGMVRIERIPAPLFSRPAPGGFTKRSKPAELLEAVNAEVKIEAFDVPGGGFVARRLRKVPASFAAADWHFEVGRDLDEKAFSAPRGQDRYHDVAVYRSGGGSPGEEELARKKVPGSSAPKGATLELEISDAGPAAYEEAGRMADEHAFALWRGSYSVSATLPWVHPLLVQKDTVSLSRTVRFLDGSEEAWTYLVLLARVVDRYPRLSQELSGPAVLSRVEPLAPPAARPLTPGAGRLAGVGYDWLGRPYWLSSVPWISTDGRDVIHDPRIALRHGIRLYQTPTEIVAERIAN